MQTVRLKDCDPLAYACPTALAMLDGPQQTEGELWVHFDQRRPHCPHLGDLVAQREGLGTHPGTTVAAVDLCSFALGCGRQRLPSGCHEETGPEGSERLDDLRLRVSHSSFGGEQRHVDTDDVDWSHVRKKLVERATPFDDLLIGQDESDPSLTTAIDPSNFHSPILTPTFQYPHCLHILHSVQIEEPQMQTMLSARQVQDVLHIDRSTVYRMAEDGRLPAIRVGKQWRFPADDIYNVVSTQPPVLNTSPLDPTVAAAIADLAGELLGVMVIVTDMDAHPITPIANPCEWMQEHRDDPQVLQTCIAEWQELAEDHNFDPRFQTGEYGFDCARAFVRRGRELVGMVLAGGVTSGNNPGFYDLDEDDRAYVLASLPKVAAALSKTASKEETR